MISDLCQIDERLLTNIGKFFMMAVLFDKKIFLRLSLLHSSRSLCNVDRVLDVEEVLRHLLAEPLPLDLPAAHPAVKVSPLPLLLVPACVRLELSRVGETRLAGKTSV